MNHTKKASHKLLGAAVGAALLLGGIVALSCIEGPANTEQVAHATTEAGVPRLARVLLVRQQPAATVSVCAPYTLYRASNEERLFEGPSLPPSRVRPIAGGIAIGSREVPCEAIRLVAHRAASAGINGTRYRGHLLLRRSGGLLSVVNVVPVEHYLRSVLASETYRTWPAASLEAQAIVARSYTLWRIAQRRGQPYDLCPDVLDQRYLGVGAEQPSTSAAVARTAGLVLLYRMQLFRCYYHSTCGGHTDAVERIFPDPPLLPLSGVRCEYCRGSKHYRWRRRIAKPQIAEALRRRGIGSAERVALEVHSRTPTGRAQQVTVTTTRGRRLTLRASDLRLRLGAQKLPSTFFELRDLGDSYEFTGRGFGHGVGLCQWGSRGMAEAGFSADEILAHYYPGATIERLYGGRDGS